MRLGAADDGASSMYPGQRTEVEVLRRKCPSSRASFREFRRSGLLHLVVRDRSAAQAAVGVEGGRVRRSEVCERASYVTKVAFQSAHLLLKYLCVGIDRPSGLHTHLPEHLGLHCTDRGVGDADGPVSLDGREIAAWLRPSTDGGFTAQKAGRRLLHGPPACSHRLPRHVR